MIYPNRDTKLTIGSEISSTNPIELPQEEAAVTPVEEIEEVAICGSFQGMCWIFTT